MAEQFDSIFHKRYVDGSGVVIDKGTSIVPKNEIRPQSYGDLLAEYRRYMNDPKAEFTQEILEELTKLGKI